MNEEKYEPDERGKYTDRYGNKLSLHQMCCTAPMWTQRKILALEEKLKCLDELNEISHSINTQDNRMTDQPIFIVQKKIKLNCMEGYNEDGHWWIKDGEEETNELRCKRLDLLLENDWREYGNYEKVCYQEHWEFVTACFTEQGCKDFIAIEGHNLGETRIYADGSYRNLEFRKVRDFLKGIEK